MPADPLTDAVSTRICKHMNDDHAEAVLAYAKHYGGVSNPAAARMVSVKAETMELEVDGASVSIAFDHILTDSEDAHRTLDQGAVGVFAVGEDVIDCLLYTSPSPRDRQKSRMPSSA